MKKKVEILLGCLVLLMAVVYFGSILGDDYPWKSPKKVLLAEALYDSTSGTTINLYELIDPWGLDDYQAEIIYPPNLSYNGKPDTVIVFGSGKWAKVEAYFKTYSHGDFIEHNYIIFRRYDLNMEFIFYNDGLAYITKNGSKVSAPKSSYFYIKKFALKNWAIFIRALRLYKVKLTHDKVEKNKEFLEKYFPDRK